MNLTLVTRVPLSLKHRAVNTYEHCQCVSRARESRGCTGWPHGEQQSVQRGPACTPAAAAFEEEQEEVEAPTRGASARPGLEPGSRRHEGNCIAPTTVAAARCLSEEDVISSSRHAQLGGDTGGRAAGQSRADSSCEAAAMCSHCADWHDAPFPPADEDGGLSGRAGGVGGRSEVRGVEEG